MYVFNRITVNPQLPKRIEKLSEIANNLWWSWNTEFLRLFQSIDRDLWEQSEKNPVKFLKSVDQSRLEDAAKDIQFIKDNLEDGEALGFIHYNQTVIDSDRSNKSPYDVSEDTRNEIKAIKDRLLEIEAENKKNK